MSTKPQTEDLVSETESNPSQPAVVPTTESPPKAGNTAVTEPAWTSCGELAADRLRTESALEAQAKAERLRELEALRERAKLD